MRCRLGKWWLFFVLPGMALASSDVDPALQLARAEATQALSTAHSPRSAAHLIRLHALRDELSDLQTFADVYLQILSNPRADPFTRNLARSFLADVERARGRLTKAAELVEPLGYLHGYYLLGAFDNEGKGGCGIDFGPESSLDLKATYPAKGHPASWRKINLRSFDDYIDLSATIRPNREAVAYALTFLQAGRETGVNLSLGTSGAFRLWFNGELAASGDRYNTPRPNQRRRYLDAALRADPSSAAARLCLAQHELGRGHPELALQVAEQLVTDYPNFAGPWLVAIRALDTLGDWPKAAEMIERAFRNF